VERKTLSPTWIDTKQVISETFFLSHLLA